MATDLATRKSASTSEDHLQRKFSELCGRIKRVDVVAHLLALALLIFTYALFIGGFDWFAGTSTGVAVQATRWSAFAVFGVLFGILGVMTVRCILRRVNPYYVARQIEQSVPGAKNGLINWLDLHDEDLPTAFQKHLRNRAAEQFDLGDPEQMLPRRRNWTLLGLLAVPTLGLLILVALGPGAFLGSMLRAFVPFYAPAPAARTIITLVEPATPDAEMIAGQSVTFAAKIEGRVPAGKHAPMLHYRWNADDDFVTTPLQSDGTGVWRTQLTASQLRAGVTYKVSAGDAETPEYQVRTRPPAYVAKLAITYTHRPFRNQKPTTRVFPDETGSRWIVHGPAGSEVEMVLQASRPVKSASVQVDGKELPIRMLPNEPQAFACRFTLERPGTFRISFTTLDGESFSDRESHPILVVDDDAPKVVLTQPGQDVSLPEDGTLEVAGHAVSVVGIKSMALHLRVAEGPDKAIKLLPLAFRDGKLQDADGTYPVEVPYQAVVPLNQLRVEKGIHLLPPGTVLEYWLEATDSADYPQVTGNVGRSLPFKVTLLPKSKDPVQEAVKRKEAFDKQKKFEDDQENSKKEKKSNGGAGGTNPNPQQSLNQIQKEQQNTNQKLSDADKGKKESQQPGKSKGAEQAQNGNKKDGPQNGGQSPQAKPSPMSQPKDAGGNKDQGGGMGQQGESRDNGEQKKDGSSKGEKKDGGGKGDGSTQGKDGGGMGKQESAGGARDGGPMGAPPQSAKNDASGADAPKPSAKNQAEPKAGDAPQQGNAKGAEQNGPQVGNKDQTASNPPQGKDKGGMAPGPNSGEAKQGPPNPANSGQARNDASKSEPKGSSWDDILKRMQNLPRDDKAGDADGKALADIAKDTGDDRKRDIIVAMLVKNGRDPKTGMKQKVPSAFGTKGGPSTGISDDIKTTAANREFAARIGQMQLDDWKSRLTPDLLKKAGLTEADWQRYVKNQQTYDALVRQLNAQAARQAFKNLSPAKSIGSDIRTVEGAANTESLRGGSSAQPDELLDALRRGAEREKK